METLLAAPLAAYARLAEAAASGSLTSAELLATVIDTTAATHSLFDLLTNDPSARALADSQPTRAKSTEINETIVAAFAGADSSPGSAVRAHAAYTVAKQGTLNLLAAGNGQLDDPTKAELVAAALRALTP